MAASAAVLAGVFGSVGGLYPLGFRALEAAIEANYLDMVITSPAHYVLLRHRYGLSSPLVTLTTYHFEQALSAFGGVIIVRDDATAIQSLADLQGRRIAVVCRHSLGGYQAQLFEFLQAGLPLPQESHLIFTDMPYDNVVHAVLQGTVEAGFVRSGVLETLAREGQIDLADLRVLHLQDLGDFPLMSSTRLFPEWPVAVLPHVSPGLTRQLVIHLLNLAIEPEQRAASALYGFSVPAEYHGIESIVRQLRLPPFDVISPVTLEDIWQQHWRWMMSVGLLLAVLMVLTVIMLVYNLRLQVARKRFATLFELSPEPTLIVVDGAIIQLNMAAVRILGYQAPEQVVHKTVLDISPEKQPDGTYSREKFQHIHDSWRIWKPFHWTHCRADGNLLEVEVNIAPMPLEFGGQARLCVWHDMTQLRKQQRYLERIAHFDALTDLPNRVLLTDRINQGMKHSRRHNRVLAVVFLDLDGFKAVNDTHGHAVGDELLVALAQRMQTSLREGDTLARIGGDEFVAVLAGLEREQDAQPVLQRLLRAVAEPVALGEVTVRVSVSMGVTFYPTDDADADLLLRHADQAMYAAKQQGKNRYTRFGASSL